MNDLILSNEQFSVLEAQSKVLFDSGLLPSTIKSYAQVVAIASLGHELGLKPWQAINGIHVIQGKPTVSPQLMLALIERSGLLEDIEINQEKDSCTVVMTRKNRKPHREFFTLELAKSMGLIGKDNWRKQPQTMLKWRAVAACARIVFPDIIQGLYLTEEIDPSVAVSEEGEVLEVKAEIVQESKQVSSKEKPVVALSAKPASEEKPISKGEIIEAKLTKAVSRFKRGLEWLNATLKGLGLEYETMSQSQFENLKKTISSLDNKTIEEDLAILNETSNKLAKNGVAPEEIAKIGVALSGKPSSKLELDRVLDRLENSGEEEVKISDIVVLIEYAQSLGRKEEVDHLEEVLDEGVGMGIEDFLSSVARLQSTKNN